MLTLSSGKPAVLKPAILSLEECLARKLANPHMENIYLVATLSYRFLILDPRLRSDTFVVRTHSSSSHYIANFLWHQSG